MEDLFFGRDTPNHITVGEVGLVLEVLEVLTIWLALRSDQNTNYMTPADSSLAEPGYMSLLVSHWSQKKRLSV